LGKREYSLLRPYYGWGCRDGSAAVPLKSEKFYKLPKSI